MQLVAGLIKKLSGCAEVALTVVSWSVTLFVTMLIVTDVVMRFFFNHPLPATWEIGEICMPHIVFLPFAHALSRGSHVRVAMLLNNLGPTSGRYVQVFGNLLSIVMCALLTWWSWLQFWESYSIQEEMLAAVTLLWWWGKIAMPIGMGMLTLAFVIQTIDLINPEPER